MMDGLEWNGDAAVKELARRLDTAALGAAVRLAELAAADCAIPSVAQSIAVEPTPGGYDVSTDHPAAAVLEFGSVRLQPRPFLSRAAVEGLGEIAAAAAAAGSGSAPSPPPAPQPAVPATAPLPGTAAAPAPHTANAGRGGRGGSGGGRRKKNAYLRRLERDLKAAAKQRPEEQRGRRT
jgi:hypothetical protein